MDSTSVVLSLKAEEDSLLCVFRLGVAECLQDNLGAHLDGGIDSCLLFGSHKTGSVLCHRHHYPCELLAQILALVLGGFPGNVDGVAKTNFTP